MTHETPFATMLGFLHELKKHAEAAGLAGRVVQTTRSEPPVLVLVNPDARRLSEEISCREGEDGWWLQWSWGDPIGRATDPAGVMALIRRVLEART